jgi:formiminotetrahydrofolate cyclodeaminase
VERLAALSQEDIDAFRAVVAARKRGEGPAGVRQAYRGAAEVPLETARCAWEGLELATRLQPLAWAMTASDVEAAQGLLQAALAGALSNVAVNLPELDGSDRSRIQPDYERLRAKAR